MLRVLRETFMMNESSCDTPSIISTNCVLCSGNATRLLMVQKRTLGLLTVKSPQFNPVHFPVLDAVALAFDISRGWYYWADSHGSIHKSDRRRSWKTVTGQFCATAQMFTLWRLYGAGDIIANVLPKWRLKDSHK